MLLPGQTKILIPLNVAVTSLKTYIFCKEFLKKIGEISGLELLMCFTTLVSDECQYNNDMMLSFVSIIR